MNAALRLLGVAGAIGALSAPAFAEDRQTTQPGDEAQKTEPATQAPPAPTMKDLLAAGYRVRDVTFIPHDAVKRAGATIDVDAVMFLLEKDAQLATCYTDLQAYTGGAFFTLACAEFK